MKIAHINGLLPKPNKDTYLAGYFPPRKWQDIHQELTFSIVLIDSGIQKIILGSLDTLFLDEQFLSDLRRRLDKDIVLMLFATHTHNAPSLCKSTPDLGPVCEDYYQDTISIIVSAIDNLILKSLKKVNLSFDQVPSNLSINRRKYSWALDYKLLTKGKFSFKKQVCLSKNKFGAIDSSIKSLIFRDNCNNPKVVVWSLAAHAAFFPRFKSISPDFPGMVRKMLQSKYGDQLTVIYLPGFAGSGIPNYKAKIFPKLRFRTFVSWVLPFKPSLPSYSMTNYKKFASEIFKKIFLQVERINKPDISKEVTFSKKKFEKIFISKKQDLINKDLNLYILSFDGKFRLLATNGEMISEWYEELNVVNHSKIIFSSYITGDCLYIPTAREIMRGGYEVNGFQKYFSMNGHFSDEMLVNVKKEFFLEIDR